MERKFHLKVINWNRRLHQKKIRFLLNRILNKVDVLNLERELGRYYQSFSSLLEPSLLFLEGKPIPYFSTFESLHNSWKYHLDDGNVQCLQKLYNRIQKENRKECEALLMWMTYLQQQGFQRIHNDLDAVRISPEIRRYYTNTLRLEDDTLFSIECHPWVYRGELVFGGILKRSEETERGA